MKALELRTQPIQLMPNSERAGENIIQEIINGYNQQKTLRVLAEAATTAIRCFHKAAVPISITEVYSILYDQKEKGQVSQRPVPAKSEVTLDTFQMIYERWKEEYPAKDIANQVDIEYMKVANITGEFNKLFKRQESISRLPPTEDISSVSVDVDISPVSVDDKINEFIKVLTALGVQTLIKGLRVYYIPADDLNWTVLRTALRKFYHNEAEQIKNGIKPHHPPKNIFEEMLGFCLGDDDFGNLVAMPTEDVSLDENGEMVESVFIESANAFDKNETSYEVKMVNGQKYDSSKEALQKFGKQASRVQNAIRLRDSEKQIEKFLADSLEEFENQSKAKYAHSSDDVDEDEEEDKEDEEDHVEPESSERLFELQPGPQPAQPQKPIDLNDLRSIGNRNSSEQKNSEQNQEKEQEQEQDYNLDYF